MMPPYLEVINNAAVPISHVLYNVNGVLHADPYHIYNNISFVDSKRNA